jgi:ATP-dependent DNA helicase RecQ
MDLAAINLEEHLKKWFGYNSFRSFQREIISEAVKGKDVLAILPTGAGKSLCYQLPALLCNGTSVVVSPLIALMQDQVDALIKGGIPAAYINSSLPLSKLKETLRNLASYKLLYIAPERLADINFINLLKEVPLAMFIIDEAHCISQWGHSFRPDYRQLSCIKSLFPDKPMMALTATATPEVEKDIITALCMREPFIAKSSFDRPNLMIRINQKQEPQVQIDEFLAKHKDKSGIIYAATRKNVDSLYERLSDRGLKVGKYHAGLSDKERTLALQNFIRDETPLMVATVAFGMGINKPDIRFILHHDMPQTIEQYYQEIGRAGRDGLPAECLMLYSAKDFMTYRSFWKDIQDPQLKSQAEYKTNAIYKMCRSSTCRRVDLLRYFGESYSSLECKGCDTCFAEGDYIDGTIISQKILSCVYRVQENFSSKHVIDVLRGAKTPEIINHGHDKLSTHNLMSEYSEKELRYYIDSLIMLGHLQSSQGDYQILQWTTSSRDLIKGESPIQFRKRLFREKEKTTHDKTANQELFEKLRQLRMDIAREEEIPPFAVFSDRSLHEMATIQPQRETDFLAINGVGRFKLQAYGQRFMKLIRECSSTPSK